MVLTGIDFFIKHVVYRIMTLIFTNNSNGDVYKNMELAGLLATSEVETLV